MLVVDPGYAVALSRAAQLGRDGDITVGSEPSDSPCSARRQPVPLGGRTLPRHGHLPAPPTCTRRTRGLLGEALTPRRHHGARCLRTPVRRNPPPHSRNSTLPPCPFRNRSWRHGAALQASPRPRALQVERRRTALRAVLLDDGGRDLRLKAPAFGDFLLAGVFGPLFGAADFVAALVAAGLLNFFRAVCVPLRLALFVGDVRSTSVITMLQAFARLRCASTNHSGGDGG